MPARLGLALAALAALLPACAKRPASAPSDPPAVIVAPAQASRLTDIGDLVFLRHRAAMGDISRVRQEIAPRLAGAAEDGADAGRDALRRLAIELAIVQGDQRSAARELDRLGDDVRDLGSTATTEERAVLALLEGEFLYLAGRHLEARRHDLRALALLERDASPLLGNALRGLARDALALGQPTEALKLVLDATDAHRQSAGAEDRELVEDLLLTVEVLVALRLADEAMIAAGDAYDQALARFGSGSLPHAEALVAVAAASLVRGEVAAAGSLVDDAQEIQSELQSTQADPAAPVSHRLSLRLQQLRALVPTDPSVGAAPHH